VWHNELSAVIHERADVVADEDKIPKIEYEVAKYLRNNLPEKKTTLLGHKVDYFIGEFGALCACFCLIDDVIPDDQLRKRSMCYWIPNGRLVKGNYLMLCLLTGSQSSISCTRCWSISFSTGRRK
jgi:hypothetical protein